MEKVIIWVGSSKNDLMSLSEDVIDAIGYALYYAQTGNKHDDAKVLKGFHGASVIEIIADDRAGTYRAVYTVKFKEVVFVLHIFQKKSKSGISTPKKELGLIENRLKQAEELYKEYLKRFKE
ncbi:MAG: type II toxin-antitoxin system RelE/ParE family toxin [Candidatus Babeliaceae bacterium]|jgi:phage-related protein